MLIVYRTSDGVVLDNTGTNNVAPTGPPTEAAYVNTDAQGIARAGLGLLRLHDSDDEQQVQLALNRQVRVQGGVLVDAGAYPPPPETPNQIADLRAEFDALKIEVDRMKSDAQAAAAKASNADAKAVGNAVAGS